MTTGLNMPAAHAASQPHAMLPLSGHGAAVPSSIMFLFTNSPKFDVLGTRTDQPFCLWIVTTGSDRAAQCAVSSSQGATEPHT